MILPIIAYGDPVLKIKTRAVDKDYAGLKELILNMHETMYKASGIGLAAPQVGLTINLFIIDGSPMTDEDAKEFKQVFINALITKREGETTTYNEGCLSIPNIREDIHRKDKISIQYYDENFDYHEMEFTGLVSRIIQHEYDHVQGVLMVDHFTPLKKRLLKNRLLDISKGNIDVDYKMKFPLRRKG